MKMEKEENEKKEKADLSVKFALIRRNYPEISAIPDMTQSPETLKAIYSEQIQTVRIMLNTDEEKNRHQRVAMFLLMSATMLSQFNIKKNLDLLPNATSAQLLMLYDQWTEELRLLMPHIIGVFEQIMDPATPDYQRAQLIRKLLGDNTTAQKFIIANNCPIQ